jgi:hypothetical protein
MGNKHIKKLDEVALLSIVEIDWMDSFDWDYPHTLPDKIIHQTRGKIFLINDDYIFISYEDRAINHSHADHSSGAAILIRDIIKMRILR